jgi:hypothetical protein
MHNSGFQSPVNPHNVKSPPVRWAFEPGLFSATECTIIHAAAVYLSMIAVTDIDRIDLPLSALATKKNELPSVA